MNLTCKSSPKNLKTKCSEIQVTINDQFLIGKSIAYLSQSSGGRRIKSLYEDNHNNDLSQCLSKNENNNKYVYINMNIVVSSKDKTVIIHLIWIGVNNVTLDIHSISQEIQLLKDKSSIRVSYKTNLMKIILNIK